MPSPCPICNNQSVDKGGILSHCLSCDHIFQDPPVVTATYDNEYVASRYDKYDTTTAMSHLRLGLLSAYAKKGRLLDIGYGNGNFVKLACKAGFDGYGSDVHGADYGVREVPVKNNLNWEAVTFFDSLEHFPSLDEVKSLTAWSHIIMVSFPCRPASFPDDLSWKHYRPGEHLHYFSLRSISRLFKGKERIYEGNLEDVVRGGVSNAPNITTVVFR